MNRHKKLAALFFATTILATLCHAQGDLYFKFPVKELQKTAQNPVSIKPCGGDAYLADFGRDAFGQLTLELDSPCDGVIKVHLAEAVRDGRADRNPGGTIRYSTYEIPLKAGKGRYAVELRPDKRNTKPERNSSGTKPILMPEEIGEVYPFRYCEIEGFKGNLTEKNITRYAVHYPFNEDASSFHCSDTVLNQIWDLCKYSIKATSFCGYYVDGDRERIPYEADALINQLAHYCVDSEYAMARKSAEYLFENPTWPTEWQLQCIIIAWNDYMYTGDKALISKYYDLLKAKTLLSLKEDNGLISTKTGKAGQEVKNSINYKGTAPIEDIVDWPRGGKTGVKKNNPGEADGYVLTAFNTAVNAFHYNSLVLMEKIALALGKRADAKDFRREAQRTLDAVNTLLVDPATGLYRDGLETDHISLHANMFPLAFGMVPQERRDAVLAFVRSRGMACSVYGSQFLLDALYDVYDDDYALSLLNSTSDRSWYNMIRRGATITMEAWDNKYKPNLDWNHAWGAAPADIIPRKLMGVEPLEPGFRKVRARPQPGTLESASALVPTPLGGVKCAFVNKTQSISLELSIPAGSRAEVWLPLPSESAVLTVGGSRKRYRTIDGFAVFNLKQGTSKCALK